METSSRRFGRRVGLIASCSRASLPLRPQTHIPASAPPSPTHLLVMSLIQNILARKASALSNAVTTTSGLTSNLITEVVPAVEALMAEDPSVGSLMCLDETISSQGSVQNASTITSVMQTPPRSSDRPSSPPPINLTGPITTLSRAMRFACVASSPTASAASTSVRARVTSSRTCSTRRSAPRLALSSPSLADGRP